MKCTEWIALNYSIATGLHFVQNLFHKQASLLARMGGVGYYGGELDVNIGKTALTKWNDHKPRN